MITSFPTFSQEELINGTRQDLEQRLIIMRQLVIDLALFNEQLEARDRQHLLEKSELQHDLEETEDDRDFWKQQCQEKEQTIGEHNRFLEWMNKLFSNKNIPTGVKLILWQYFLIISLIKPTPIGEETQISMQFVAARLGINPATVRRATDKLQDHGLLERRYEPVEIDGEKRLHVHIKLNEAVTQPKAIDIGRNQGGDHRRRCPNPSCASHDMPEDDKPTQDSYTVRYCPCCKEAAWYGQPGLRGDASVEATIASIAQGKNRIHPTLASREQVAQELPSCPTENASVISEDEEQVVPTIEASSIESVPTQVVTEHSLSNNHGKLQQEIDCSCCIGIERGPKPTAPCWQCGHRSYRWNHLNSSRPELNQRWVCTVCS